MTFLENPQRLVLVAVLLLTVPVHADPTVDTGRMKDRVQELTKPELAGRGSGSNESFPAAEYIASWMSTHGLEPAFDGQWFQEFPLKGEGWIGNDLKGLSGHNIAGTILGRGDLVSRFVVIGAHHDHLGRLVEADPSLVPAAGQYYPGANDNASGLAVLGELMALVDSGNPSESARSVIFVSFGAEEVGLQGSAFFVNSPPVPWENIDVMINFDTVGQMNEDKLYISGVGTAAALTSLVEEANQVNLDLSLAQGGWSGSDHMSFNTRQVPVLFVFGGPYKEYNTPRDTWDTLNYSGLEKITDYSLSLVRGLRNHPQNLDWIMVAQKESLEEKGPQDRRSWLGTLPDFTEEIQGYKLAGVFDDSPAANAGLLKGDVLTQLAGHEVRDLASFTRALRSNSPGDLVEITLLRQGQTLNFTVVLGDRQDRK